MFSTTSAKGQRPYTWGLSSMNFEKQREVTFLYTRAGKQIDNICSYDESLQSNLCAEAT